jgi:hypothetical protein
VKKLAVLLAAAGLSIVAGGCATSGTGSSAANSSVKVNPNLITTAEIDANNLRDAYEIVQRLRPTWLTRSTTSVVNMGGSTPRTSTSNGYAGPSGGLVVYLDNAKMGGPDALRDLPGSTIGSIQYMDAATATATLPGLGSDIVTGAIVVHSRVGH